MKDISECLATALKGGEEYSEALKRDVGEKIHSFLARVGVTKSEVVCWEPARFMVLRGRYPSVQLYGMVNGIRYSSDVKWKGSRRKTRVAAKRCMGNLFVETVFKPVMPVEVIRFTLPVVESFPEIFPQ